MNSKILRAQRHEISEYYLYKKIAKSVKDKKTKEIISLMAEQEKSHYEVWKSITQKTVRPSWIRVNFFYYLARIFGLSFGLKFMERDEGLAIQLYNEMRNEHPQLAKMIKEEQEHEQKLLSLINSKVLDNVSSIILGLNDALVELTGALAGFTFALADTKIIAMVGLITGVAAAFSMAASSYLAAKEDAHKKNPLFAGLLTGSSYIVAVIILVCPFFLWANPFYALINTLAFVLFIIFIFNFYIAISRGTSFKKKFAEMALISVGAALINFGIGYLVKNYFGV
jgi:VIT1/CCC1 family predicted Fe2+/Mn2+ transporter